MDHAERQELHRVVLSQDDLVAEVWSATKREWRGVGTAEVEAGASLNIAIYAQQARDAGFPAASGACAFAMLVAQAQRARRVAAILGRWHRTSDNWKRFRELVAGGGSNIEAAAGTFTGQQAAIAGFPVVALVEDQDDVVTARFEPRRRDDE